MTNRERLDAACEHVNDTLNRFSAESRIKLGYINGKVTIYETNQEGGIICYIIGGLTRTEAINMLVVMVQTIHIANNN